VNRVPRDLQPQPGFPESSRLISWSSSSTRLTASWASS
jgi:hypothetical protein